MNKVKKFFTKLKWENIIAAILAIVVGVLFIILPKDSADVLCLIAGILLICAGAFTLVAYIFSGFFLGAHLLIVGIMLILMVLHQLLIVYIVQKQKSRVGDYY